MTTTLISATCIRFYDTGPEYHIDGQHATFGLIDTSVQPYVDSAGYLVIKFLEVGPFALSLRKTGSLNPGPDETLTKNGISAGASNGGPYARIRFRKDGVGYLNLTIEAHYLYLVGDTTNLWFLAAHEIS